MAGNKKSERKKLMKRKAEKTLPGKNLQKKFLKNRALKNKALNKKIMKSALALLLSAAFIASDAAFSAAAASISQAGYESKSISPADMKTLKLKKSERNKHKASYDDKNESHVSSGMALKPDDGYTLDTDSGKLFAFPDSAGFYYIEHGSKYDEDKRGYLFKVKFFDCKTGKTENIYSSFCCSGYRGVFEMPAYRTGNYLYILQINSRKYAQSEKDSRYIQLYYSYSIIRIDMRSASQKEYASMGSFNDFTSFCVTDDGRIILSDDSRMYVYDRSGNIQSTSVSMYSDTSADPSSSPEAAENSKSSDSPDVTESPETSGTETGGSGSSADDIIGSSKIVGYDPSNGNIYYEGVSNWVYWGYDHNMASADVANLGSEDAKNGNDGSSGIQNKITFSSKPLSFLYQKYFYDHEGSFEMLDGGYLGILDTFTGNTLTIADSAKTDLKNITDSVTSINPLNSHFSVTKLNLSNADEANVFSINTKSSSTPDAGCRACYNPANKKFYVMTGARKISEIDKDKKDITSSVKTTCPLYKVMTTRNDLIAVTKDGSDFYVQIFPEQEATEIKIVGESSVKKGESTEYSAVFDSDFSKDVTFSSTNPDVMTISKNGKASAWKNGSTLIKAETADGKISDSITVNVIGTGSEISEKERAESSISELSGGVTTDNIDEKFYSYDSTVKSYLYELNDGRLMRVEYASGKVTAEYYRDGVLEKTKTADIPLDIFGGFYKGRGAYYVVSGQNNENEDDSLEIIRVEKYDENWNRISSCSINSINTYHPFDAGSLRMTEAKGYLYIHTCHVMYKSDDGLHHQANMTFKINESDMTIADKYTGVMNLSTGYVSHSFDQYIKTDGMDIYRVDLGDAYPRGIAITAVSIDSKVSSPYAYGCIFPARGQVGNNYTGMKIGGFELAGENALVAGVYDADPGDSLSSDYGNARNLFVVVFNKSTGNVSSRYITSYKADSTSTVKTCRLVKIDDNHLMLLWVEDENGKRVFHYAQIDENGEIAGQGTAGGYILSNCQPVIGADGSVMWYASDGKKVNLYKLNPFDMDDVKKTGDDYEQKFGQSETPLPGESSSPQNTRSPYSPDSPESTTAPYGPSDTRVTSSPEATGTRGTYSQYTEKSGYTYTNGKSRTSGGKLSGNSGRNTKPGSGSYSESSGYSEDEYDDDTDLGFISGKITVNIKNKKTCRLNKKIKINARARIKKVTLNGHKLPVKKNRKKYSFRLEKYIRFLYSSTASKKYNILKVSDKRYNTKKVKFKVIK